jgi:FkbM family methyltransferase
MGDQSNLKEFVESIFMLIPGITVFHSKDKELYSLFDRIIKTHFANSIQGTLDIVPLDGMVWPRINMGNVSSYDFFSFEEFIVFSFYWINRNIYRTAFDFGANIGLHSIVLSRFGYEVHAFEPDPTHYNWLIENLSANHCQRVSPNQQAVSNRSGVSDFVRVKGNTTANHILGARDFYGEVEYLKVATVAFSAIGVVPDLMKIDIEGHEKTLLLSIDQATWGKTDAIVDVHGPTNSQALFDHFHGSGINLFAQKRGWQKVERVEDMPMNNKQGLLFISKKPEMPW